MFYGSGRTVELAGLINEDKVRRVKVELELLASQNDLPIALLFNSNGGDWCPAEDLYDFIRNLRVPVVGVVSGDCKSVAAVVLQACSARVIQVDRSILIHSIVIATQAPIVKMTPEWLATVVEQGSIHQNRMIEIIGRRSGADPELITKWLAGDTTFSAKAALKYRLVDAIIPNRPR